MLAFPVPIDWLTKRLLQGLPENYAPLLVENIKKGEFTHVIAGHSAFGKNLMPRVAALLDSQQISDITGIESEDSKLVTMQDCYACSISDEDQPSLDRYTLETQSSLANLRIQSKSLLPEALPFQPQKPRAAQPRSPRV